MANCADLILSPVEYLLFKFWITSMAEFRLASSCAFLELRSEMLGWELPRVVEETLSDGAKAGGRGLIFDW